jgi:cysteine-rich repeat protein
MTTFRDKIAVVRKLIGVLSLASVLVLPTLAYAQRSSGLLFVDLAVSTVVKSEFVTVSPDGGHVYSVSSSLFLETFARDPLTGQLTSIDVERDGEDGVDGLRRPRSIAVSPDSSHVYVASESDDSVAVFERNAGDGMLTFVEVQEDGVGGVDGIDGAQSVTVSPDGKHVYVAAESDNALAVFSRDAITGELTFVEAEFDNSGGVDGLDHASFVTVSPDGASVYAAGRRDSGMVVFSRNAATGELTFVEFLPAILDGPPQGLRRVNGIVVSPDGKHVYTAGRTEDTVGVFARDVITGELSFIEVQEDRVNGVEGLETVRAVAVSPDGAHVYAAGSSDDAVVIFHRDASTGTLRFVDRLVDGVDGAGGLDVVEALAVSPDGLHIYGAGGSDGIPVLGQDTCGSGELTGDEQCDDGNAAGGDGCAAGCTLELCGSVPTMGCRKPTVAGRGLLTIKNNVNDTRDRFGWKWKLGPATDTADFGDPLTTASYMLCVYDESLEPQPHLGLAAPAGGSCLGKPCWKVTTHGFQYKERDKARTPDGLDKIVLKSGAEGMAKILMKGKGPKIGAGILPLTPKVTAQLHNTDTSVCWDIEFSSPSRNDTRTFRSKSD